jgi:hypothetical protein
MSADGAAGADAGIVDGGDAGGMVPEGPRTYGTIGDVRDALGLDEIEDLPPDDRDQTPTTDEIAAKRDEKGRFQKGEGDGAEPAAAKGKDDAKEDDDVATVKAIEARAKARRQAREQGRREREAKARPAPAPAAAAPAAAPAQSAPAKPEPGRAGSPVETAVRDVLAQIEKLATGDAEAAAAQDGAPAADTDERRAQVAALTTKLDELKKGLATSEEGKKQLTELQEQVRALESDRIIRRKISEAISDVADEVPTLLNASALRAFNKKNGTKYADAVEMIGAAAARYFEKFKKAPDLALMAKRIEAKLKGASPEQTRTETETDEKPTPKSKTISRNDGAPPAARGRDDERSYEEAQADFLKKYGLDD